MTTAIGLFAGIGGWNTGVSAQANFDFDYLSKDFTCFFGD